MIDRYEELLRYRAGELAPEAARAVEAWPDLAERLAELDALDAQLQALPTVTPNVEQLVSRVRRPRPRRSRWLGATVAGLAAAAVLALVLRSAPDDAWLLAPLGEGTQLDGRDAPRLPERLGRVFRARAGSGGAQLLSRRGWLGLSPGAAVSSAGELELTAGLAAVEADGLTLRVGEREVTIHGQAVVSAEPGAGSLRVTEAATSLSAGATMKTDWMKLSSVALTAATVGGGLTVLVLDGRGRIDEPGAAPIELRAGEQVSPASSRTPRPARPPSPPAAVVAEETPSVRVPADLAPLDRPQLVALVERLRDEKESLLTQRAALKQALASREKEEAHPKRNFYRFEPVELLASAKLGEVRMRGPQVDGSALKLTPENASKLGLTPEEAAKVEAIYAASSARVRDGFAKLYTEIGGDPSALSTLTIFEELRMKALPGEYEDAVRRLADARAGLPAAPGAAPGPTSAIGRAFALLDQEDQRTLTELEQLIGPARTEAMVNDDKNFPHHNHTFGVGPRKP